MKFVLLFVICSCLLINVSVAQKKSVKNEDGLLGIAIPDPLKLLNGKKIRNTRKWEKFARPELLMLFENNVYGKVPGSLTYASFDLIEENSAALDNRAKRKQIQLNFKKDSLEFPVNVLIYLPKTDRKVPVFLAYNFNGNHSVIYDSEIVLTEAWVRDNPSLGIINNQITEQSRGVQSENWPIEKILENGYGLVTVYYGEIDPDKDDFTDGIHPFFYSKYQNRPRSGEWGSISAWAWGLSRVLDYLYEDPDVDENKVIVMGHSRLGKAALWAGAQDERFSIIISNNSGCGGAALFKRKKGETVKVINKNFPHWFSSNFKYFNYNEEELPVDQHELIALIAPRPVYVASAEEDLWSDPEGEYLSAYYASKVYELYGRFGLKSPTMPEVNHPIMNQIGYHIRSGAHDIKEYDWEQYIKFADMHLKQSIVQE